MKDRVCHFIPYIGRQFGGPVLAMAGMCEGLINAGYNVTIASIHSRHDGLRVPFLDSIELILGSEKEIPFFYYSSQLRRDIKRADFSLIHSHGLWTDVHRLAASEARRRVIPHLVGTCGMLNPAALSRSMRRKQLISRMFQRRALSDASCLLANSKEEANDIRTFGIKPPISIIPNPVSPTGGMRGRVSETVLFNQFPFLTIKRTVLYLGRIHPVKGIERLVHAWKSLGKNFGEWQLILAGPAEINYKKEIIDLIRTSNLENTIHFTGELDDVWKWEVINRCSVFVMPSDYENFGVSIAEALTAGKPVITTKGSPWQVVEDKKVGWWVDADSIAKALIEAMEMSEEELSAMGAKGKQISSEFTTRNVGKKLVRLYEWLLNGGRPPATVRLN